MTKSKHVAVLLKPTVTSLQVKPEGVYVDVTLGGAGHTRKILAAMNWQGKLIAFDQDPKPIDSFKKSLIDDGFVLDVVKGINHLHKQGLDIYLVARNFSQLEGTLAELKLGSVDGVMADLGLSTDQLFEKERGFSYLSEGKLDMRMSPEFLVTAADLLNGLYEKELENMFLSLGDVDFYKKLSRAIVKARNLKPFTRPSELKNLVHKIVPLSSRLGTNKHPEAKVFQALRIAVNDELNHLRKFLPQAFNALRPGGRLSVITFHSGEDRIVKNDFRDRVQLNNARYVYKILKTEEAEKAANARSHSAKLRSIEKI